LTDTAPEFFYTYLYSNTASFYEKLLKNPFNNDPDKTIHFLSMGDVFKTTPGDGVYVGISFYLHKTQFVGTRSVYDFIALMSDIGGFQGLF
jgi:hypothetical protein